MFGVRNRPSIGTQEEENGGGLIKNRCWRWEKSRESFNFREWKPPI